ncbi:hypothetical protein BH24ACT3_BH24ACT3_03430 [soil metagenome]
MKPAVLFVALALLAGSCGLPQDSEPIEMSTEGVPSDLIETSSTTSTEPTGETQPVQLYFVDREAYTLEAVTRPLETPVTPADALNALLLGIQVDEEDPDLVDRLPTALELASQPRLDDGVLTIDLSTDIDNISGLTQREAFAQLVWTATGLDDVDRVTFRVEGAPRQASTTDVDAGQLEVVNRDDYALPFPLPR